MSAKLSVLKFGIIAAAGAAMCLSAAAQDEINMPVRYNGKIVRANNPGGYGSRDTEQIVYRLGDPGVGGFAGRGGAYMGGDDINISRPAVLNGIGYCVSCDGAATDPPTFVPYAIRFKFYTTPPYDITQITNAGPLSPPPEAFDRNNFIGQRTFQLSGVDEAGQVPPGGAAAGYINNYDAIYLPFDLSLEGTGLSVPATFFVIEECLAYDLSGPSTAVGPIFRSTGRPCPGSSDIYRWADNAAGGGNRDGFLSRYDDTTTTASEDEIFPARGATTPRGLYLILRGIAAAPTPPAVFTDIGNLADLPSRNSRTGTLASGGVNWWRFNLPGSADVSDAAYRFLDISTDGSIADTTIALYDSNGALVGLVGSDDDSNLSGTNDLLTYGIGRRDGPEAAAGRQRDGHNGEIRRAANPGPYYVAVADTGTDFGPGFCISAVAAGGGDYALNFETNVSGGALAASVPPLLRGGSDLGTIVDPGANMADYTTQHAEADFLKFTVCQDICTPEYMDFDWSASAAVANYAAVLFDSSGNVVVTSYDATPDYNRPLLSFGDFTAPRMHGTNPVPFMGQTRRFLSAGDYYLGTADSPLTVASGRDRFHARGANVTNSLPYNVTVYTNTLCSPSSDPCALVYCCPADYNGDGGVDGADVAAFYADWENSIGCSDVNLDGGPDGDVETFFSFWEAGGC